jgi:thymidylate kinase
VNEAILVSFEGLDGSGKTQISQYLAATTNALLMPTVPDGFRKLWRDYPDFELLDARFYFFLSAVGAASVGIRRQLETGRNVIVESYYHRTLAYHRGMGSRVQANLPSSIRVPEVTFYFGVEEEERKRRLLARNDAFDAWSTAAEGYMPSIESEYRLMPMHRLYTSGRIPSEVAHEVLQHPLDGTCGCRPLPSPTQLKNLESILAI